MLCAAAAAVAEEAAPAAGARVYAKWCGACHDPGPGHPGTQRLAWSFGDGKSDLKSRTDLDPEYIKRVVRNGRLEMPSLRPTEISDAELDALVRYLTAPTRKLATPIRKLATPTRKLVTPTRKLATPK